MTRYKKEASNIGEFCWLSFTPWVIEILKGLEANTWLADGSPYIPKKVGYMTPLWKSQLEAQEYLAGITSWGLLNCRCVSLDFHGLK